MTWEYALIGLVVGFVIGALVMRFGNTKLRQQGALQTELENNKLELEEYRKELVGHFAHSAELLDNMARDYRQLYQHMVKSSHELMPNMPVQENPFNYRLTESEADNDQAPVKMPPKDYSDGASGLFRPVNEKSQ
ncbi:Z-ring associated protein ZapG [Photorhabdus stackebrandtii]|uniref:Z-ring associated protein G n=1 Tax=Photorhabdus stackebrandtii TaxID=1123042 RepID=A0A7X5QKP8_9GAMM|nr:Z-ring associated protein ZapG [Photorhabdus stackebrandtii]NHB96247.1 cytochrome D ubiquinol oxidase subunit III [Photorhabdus stackebrandtii]